MEKKTPAYICLNPLCYQLIDVDELPAHLEFHKEKGTEPKIESFEKYQQLLKAIIIENKKKIERNIQNDPSQSINLKD